MGHQHAGYALQRHYDQGMKQINLAAATMDGEDEEAPDVNYSREFLPAGKS